MALIEVLTPNEQKLFDSPPQFQFNEERKNYFKLDEGLNKIVNNLRGTINKIGFILQLGYFRSSGRFFVPRLFHKKDLKFIINQFNFTNENLNLEHYSSSVNDRHQDLILEYLGYVKFDPNVFMQEIQRLSHKFIRPKQILMAIKENFRKLKIELPGYHMFAETISNQYNRIEKDLLTQITAKLTHSQSQRINDLLPSSKENDEGKPYKRSELTGLRTIKQSLKPKDIRFNIQNFIKIKSLYTEFKPLIGTLNLSKEAVNYYANWVLKARTHQVAQFANIYKRTLHVTAFIDFQHAIAQDLLVDILLRSTQSTLNHIKQLQKDRDFEKRDARNNSIKLLTECSNKSRNLLAEIEKIINTNILTDRSKVQKIKKLLAENSQEFDRLYAGKFDQLQQDVALAIKGQDYFEIMEKLSVKLQLRVSDLIKQLDFSPNNSDQNMIAAINYYKKVDGKIDHKAPTSFLEPATLAHLYDSKGELKVSLYKALLFIGIAEAIKSGNLNLAHSYRYLAIDEYLIEQERWEKDKIMLLKRAGMLKLLDFKKVIKKYKKAINDQFTAVNQNILNDKNPYIKFK